MFVGPYSMPSMIGSSIDDYGGVGFSIDDYGRALNSSTF